LKSVLVISPYGPQYGPRRTLEHVVRAVALAGFRPVCVVRTHDAISAELSALDPAVRIVESLGTVPRTIDPRRLGRFVRAHRSATAAIASIASTENAAAIYTVSEAVLAGGLAARRTGLPSATHVIGMSIQSPRLLARAYIGLLDRLSSRFVACSTAVAAMLKDNGVSERRIDLVHNAIPLAAVESSASLPAPLPAGGPRIGMVAGYDPRKGHDLFVDAAALVAASHPDARFYIVGGILETQPESAAFERHVAHAIASQGLANALEQVGFVAAPEVYAWMRAMDVVVAPSRTEGFAHTVLEAMACSRPIVATAIEGNLDALVHDASGLLVEPVPEAIAAGIRSLLDDPLRASALGDAAHVRVQAEFDELISIPQLAETIAALGSIEPQ
jgi:glycosyltransferase involved in cell wall biosynthesis